MSETQIGDDSSAEAAQLTYAKMTRNPKVLVGSLIIGAAMISATFLDPTLEPHLRPLHLTPSQLGLLWLAAAGVFCAMSPVIGFVSTKLSNKLTFMTVGLLCMTVALIFLSPAQFVPIKSTVTSNALSFVAFDFGLAITIIPTFEYLQYAVTTGNGAEDNVVTHGLVSGW